MLSCTINIILNCKLVPMFIMSLGTNKYYVYSKLSQATVLGLNTLFILNTVITIRIVQNKTRMVYTNNHAWTVYIQKYVVGLSLNIQHKALKATFIPYSPFNPIYIRPIHCIIKLIFLLIRLPHVNALILVRPKTLYLLFIIIIMND